MKLNLTRISTNLAIRTAFAASFVLAVSSTLVDCTQHSAETRPNETVKPTTVPRTPSPAPVAGGEDAKGLKDGVEPTPADIPPLPAEPPPPPAAVPPPPPSVLVDGPPVRADCVVLPKITNEPPIYLPGQSIVVTRIMKACTTTAGQTGWEKDTPWLAMGFPCTGGTGRIDIKGHYANPHMVSYIVGTDCQMSPIDRNAVKKVVEGALGLPATAKLMAFTPFVVQYWEIPGFSDADTGFSIDLRSAPAIEGEWRRFQKKEPLKVRLFGRENAWVQGGFFYMVEADLKISGTNHFQLAVTSVKKLSPEDLAAVKTRCEALKPTRNCAEVF